MKKSLTLALIPVLLAAGCGAPSLVPSLEATLPGLPAVAEPTSTPTPEATPTATPTPEDFGPTGFPSDVNPLTGLRVADPSRLERRPLLIKVSNLPRSVRPQWGLSLADIVFEYYTEEGTTRFAALFLGRDAEMVGPIRSARFIDVHLVRGYDAIFGFGSAYVRVLDRLYSSEFTDRLVIEGSSTPMFRYDPAGFNHLMVGTAALSEFMTASGVENGPQNLDGMTFQHEPPAGGAPVPSFMVRYSGAIYNRWDYDPTSGEWLRFVDAADDPFPGGGEVYEQAQDRLTGEPLSYDTVVVLQVLHESYDVEVWDIQLLGSGKAYVFRDGQMYETRWVRAPDSVISLVNADGTPFPYKPGETWFEIIGQNSLVETTGSGLRFTHSMP